VPNYHLVMRLYLRLAEDQVDFMVTCGYSDASHSSLQVDQLWLLSWWLRMHFADGGCCLVSQSATLHLISIMPNFLHLSSVVLAGWHYSRLHYIALDSWVILNLKLIHCSFSLVSGWVQQHILMWSRSYK
jgi:hypothetical protein